MSWKERKNEGVGNIGKRHRAGWNVFVNRNSLGSHFWQLAHLPEGPYAHSLIDSSGAEVFGGGAALQHPQMRTQDKCQLVYLFK